VRRLLRDIGIIVGRFFGVVAKKVAPGRSDLQICTSIYADRYMIITGKDGSIGISVDHLLEDVPDKFDDIVERYKSLPVRLFFHVVSSPKCSYERKFGKGRVPELLAKMSARERFLRILTGRMIHGNPKSYFVNKHKECLTASQVEGLKSVSFTLCDFEELPAHFNARGSSYGVCFFHDFLQHAGIRPVVHLPDHELGTQREIVFNSPFLVETYGRAYDMRWENEWRIKKELRFSNEDIAFLIAPDDDYETIANWTFDNGFECPVLPASIFYDPLSYLRMLPKLHHESWGQIRLFEDLLLDFEEFKPYTEDDRRQMTAEVGDILSCIVRVDLLEQYQHRYTQRYLEFVGALNDETKSLPLIKKYENIQASEDHTWHASCHLGLPPNYVPA
jgi:hypothetical protein